MDREKLMGHGKDWKWMNKPITKDPASFDAELVGSRLIEARGVGKVQETHAEMGEQLMEQVGQCMGVG